MVRNAFILVAFTLVLVLFHIHGLDSGTPSVERSALLFSTLEEIPVDAMIVARQSLFQGYDRALAGDPRFKDKMWVSKSMTERLVPGKIIPREQVVDFMRGYLLGVPSDDQQTLSAMSQVKPREGKWDPGNYTYGDFYFGLLGVFLGLAKAVGYLPHELAVRTLLVTPITVSHLYVVSRFLSAILSVVAALFLFLLASLELSVPFAFLAALYFFSSPLTVIQSHAAKPHTLGPALILAAVYYYQRKKLRTQEEKTDWMKASLCIGLAAASAITNYLAFILIPLKALVRNAEPVQAPLNRFGRSLALASACAILFNPFPYWRFHRFSQVLLVHHVQGYDQGKFRLEATFSFLQNFLCIGVSYAGVPLILLGVWYLYRRKSSTGILLASLAGVYAFFDVFFMRHPAIGLFVLPSAGWLMAYGTSGAWDKNRNTAVRALLVMCWLGSFGTFFYHDLSLRLRWARFGNLTSAGAWINEHVQKNASIGVVGGAVTPGTLPPFHMLNYHLVTLSENPRSWTESVLPEYVVYSDEKVSTGVLEALAHSYKLIFRNALAAPFDRPEPFMLDHENVSVTVWKR